MMDISNGRTRLNVYIFFDKKSKDITTHTGVGVISERQKLPIRKLIIRQFKKWGADLAELQLISMCNKGIKFLVCGIDM